jgi:hypothetical protein
MKRTSLLQLVASIAISATWFMAVSVANAGTGGGISPERHETCALYAKLANKVWKLKSSGYEKESVETKLIGELRAMSTPVLAKRILDITRHVYSKPMNEASARDTTYDLCASGKLQDM